MKGLGFLSPWLAALFGAGGVGFPELAGPSTGNQRGQQRRAAQHRGVTIARAEGYDIDRRTGAIVNPFRNAQRKQLRAMGRRQFIKALKLQRRQPVTRSTHG